MITLRYLLLLTITVMGAVGCAVIAGSDEPAGQQVPGRQIAVRYLETLRNQASLGGESLKEVPFGSSSAASLQEPRGVFADQFRVYVTDRLPTPRLLLFDRGDRSMTVVTGPTPSVFAPVQFVDPSAVAAWDAITIYVADPPQGKVFGMDRNGTLFLTIGAGGELSFPVALAADIRHGRLYIADKQANTVWVHTGRGGRLLQLDAAGREKGMRSPVGVSLDRAGNCYTLAAGHRVFVHDAEGRFIRSFQLKSPSGGKMRLRGIAVDSRGHLYVTDGQNNMVLIYDRDGLFLQSFGRTGMGVHDEFRSPAGIFIDQQDRIYIADQLNGRIQVYQSFP